MEKKKYYPKKQHSHNNQVPIITKPFAFDNRIVISPKDILKVALLSNATSVILGHNQQVQT